MTEHTFPDWEKLYQEQRSDTLPWFHAELDPDLAAALATHGPASGRFLDLGTGPGSQAIGLSLRGYDVTGTDLSPSALTGAARLAESRGARVTFVQDDVLASRLTGPFAAIFDRGCFHTISPADRPRYVATVAALLPPGAVLYLKTFSHRQPGTVGPYKFTPDEHRDIFGERFDLLSCDDTVYQGTLDPLPLALFSVLRRR